MSSSSKTVPAHRLSAAKRRLLEQRMRGEVPAMRPAARLRPQPRPPHIPLSHAQQRLWFIDQLQGTTTEYNMVRALRLRGPLDVPALERAVATIVARHETLRTHFVVHDGTPAQVIAPEASIQLVRQDCSPDAELSDRDQIMAALRAEIRQPFDLSRGPLLRLRLLRMGPDDHVLVRAMHHVVSDAWSEAIFTRELIALYDADHAGRPDPLPPLPLQYADFAIWQRSAAAEDALREGVGYWTRQLAGAPERLALPTIGPRPPLQTFAASAGHGQVMPELLARLRAVAGAHNATLYMTMLAAFGVLLTRYSNQEDLIIGSPIANRGDADLEPLIGLFANLLALRVQPSPRQRFSELLSAVRETTLQAYRYQDVPFERLVELVAPTRRPDTPPLVQVVFDLHNAPMKALALPDLSVKAIQREEMQTPYDLALHAWEYRGRLFLGWLYNRDLFDHEQVGRMNRHFGRVLESIAANPDQRLGDIDMLEADERRQLVVGYNDTARPIPGESLASLFAAQAARVPDAVALVDGDHQLSYAALDQRANQLAHTLIAYGVRPGHLVAIAVDRASEMAPALLAVVKAGAAYVPLDVTHPPERLERILGDAAPICVVATADHAASIPSDRVLLLDADDLLNDAPTSGPPPMALPPQAAAYVMYTSGSTGVPKGIVVPHEGVVRLVVNTDYVRLAGGDRIGQVSNTAFDASTFEFWCAWLNALPAVLIDRDEALSPPHLHAALQRQQVTILFLTTALFNQVVQSAPAAFDGLRYVLFGGEAVDPQWPRRALGRGPHIVHVYGPTETTTFATAQEIGDVPADAETVPIGAPIANTRAYVLDRFLEPAPAGVIGELYIGGPGLAHGYLNQRAATAARFVAHPHGGSGERIYRTGDLVKRGAGGAIEFVGRVDAQIKLRGFRIEPGEIETVLRRDARVNDALVVLYGDGDTRRLVAYVVASDGAEGSDAAREELGRDLQAAATRVLPEFMVPTAIVVLDAWPLTPNGKIDRKALPAPESKSDAREWSTPTEVVLRQIFGEILDVDAVGIDDDFFALGGHSLLVPRLVNQIHNVLGIDVPLQVPFESTTVRALAPRLQANEQFDAGLLEPIIPMRPGGTLPPLLCLPPGGGLGWRYAGLLGGLDPDRPLYTLQSPGIKDQSPMPASMDEFIAYFTKLALDLRGNRPCCLLGWSFGGLLAHGIACHLQRQGVEVPLLALLDAYPLDGDPLAAFQADNSVDVNAIRKRLKADPPPGVNPAQIDRMARLMIHTGSIATGFRPDRFDGDVLLFATADHAAWAPYWQPYVSGHIEVVSIETTHHKMVEPRHLLTIGSTFEQALHQTTRRAHAV